MRTHYGVKKEKIMQLEQGIEQLCRIINGDNELEIYRLCRIINHTIEEMKELKFGEALMCYRTNINDDIRKALQKFDIRID